MDKDALIKYEENNYDKLVEGFVEKYRKEWYIFLLDQYMNDMPEPVNCHESWER